MERAVNGLKECTPIDLVDFDEDRYNTIFEYELNEFGLRVARGGLENLRMSAPFVLTMLSDIEEIAIESSGEIFRLNRKVECGLENATVSEIIAPPIKPCQNQAA